MEAHKDQFHVLFLGFFLACRLGLLRACPTYSLTESFGLLLH